MPGEYKKCCKTTIEISDKDKINRDCCNIQSKNVQLTRHVSSVNKWYYTRLEDRMKNKLRKMEHEKCC